MQGGTGAAVHRDDMRVFFVERIQIAGVTGAPRNRLAGDESDGQGQVALAGDSIAVEGEADAW